MEGDFETEAPDPAVEPATSSNVEPAQVPPSQSDLPPLLLPDHVFVSEAAKPLGRTSGSKSDDPPSPTLSMSSDIQFIDDDKPVSPKPLPVGCTFSGVELKLNTLGQVQRYFEIEEKKSSGRLCSTCGEAGHLARACKVKLVCNAIHVFLWQGLTIVR